MVIDEVVPGVSFFQEVLGQIVLLLSELVILVPQFLGFLGETFLFKVFGGVDYLLEALVLLFSLGDVFLDLLDGARKVCDSGLKALLLLLEFLLPLLNGVSDVFLSLVDLLAVFEIILMLAFQLLMGLLQRGKGLDSILLLLEECLLVIFKLGDEVVYLCLEVGFEGLN